MPFQRLKHLKSYHREAMNLRIDGYTLREIAEKLGVSTKVVQTWFYRDSLFIREFENLLERRKKEVLDSAFLQIYRGIPQAAARMLELLSSDDKTAFLSAKDILDRMGVKTKDEEAGGKTLKIVIPGMGGAPGVENQGEEEPDA